MKTKLQFTRLDLALLLLNTVAFGRCVVLLLLGRTSGPLVLLTVGVAGMLAGHLGRAYYRSRRSRASIAATGGALCRSTSL
jgi:hypothetical protein